LAGLRTNRSKREAPDANRKNVTESIIIGTKAQEVLNIVNNILSNKMAMQDESLGPLLNSGKWARTVATSMPEQNREI